MGGWGGVRVCVYEARGVGGGGERVSVFCCSVPRLNAIGSKHTEGSKERLFVANQ